MQHEAKAQAMIFEWANLQKAKYKELELLFAIPNGGKRNQFEAYNLKRQGLKPGVPDMFLPVARGKHHGLWIELKIGKNKPSESQKWWIENLNNQGYLAIVCYGYDEAIKNILKYIVENY